MQPFLTLALGHHFHERLHFEAPDALSEPSVEMPFCSPVRTHAKPVVGPETETETATETTRDGRDRDRPFGVLLVVYETHTSRVIWYQY